MKTGKSITELAAELERQSQTKRDFMASAETLALESNGVSKLHLGAESMELNETAHEQFAERLDIPKKYYDRMRSQSPALLDKNVNHWLGSSKSKFLVRTLDNNVRAVLSDKYRPLDNLELAEIALPSLLKSGARIESCEVTEKKLYIKAVTERITLDIKPGDTVQAGIVISNSEIGYGALSIEPLLFRLVCSNGLVVNQATMRRTHVGRGNKEFEGVTQFFKDETREADDRAFWLKVRDSLQAAFSEIGFEAIVNQFRAAQGDKIEADPIKVVEIAQKRFSLSDSERNGVLSNFLRENDMSRFGLVNAVTRHAQDIESYDRASEFERLGGTILELPKKDWTVIANAN